MDMVTKKRVSLNYIILVNIGFDTVSYQLETYPIEFPKSACCFVWVIFSFKTLKYPAND